MREKMMRVFLLMLLSVSACVLFSKWIVCGMTWLACGNQNESFFGKFVVYEARKLADSSWKLYCLMI
jgi:hypothetical protein